MFNIGEYLDENGFLLSYNKENVVNSFISEMERKLQGKNSSLGMLSSHIKSDGNIRTNEKVIVIDAGGTNLRISTLYFNSNFEVVIDDFFKTDMPGVINEVNKDQFYTEIAKAVYPYITYSNKIGFCFSYPVDLESSSEGKILNMCKEIKSSNVVGSYVCKNLNKKIVALGGQSKKITLLNDSTATLLAGVVADRTKKWDSYIGVILGTGSNSCYIEESIINVESGWFNNNIRGKFDIELDNESNNPGSYYFEKATSGAYLGKLATLIFKDLYNKGVINSKIDKLSTKEINDFLYDSINSKICIKEEKGVFKEVIERVVERSSLNLAINLASLIIKVGKGKSKDKPICITADGTTFYSLKNYQQRVERYLDSILDDKYHYKIVKVDKAPVIGAAIAALSN